MISITNFWMEKSKSHDPNQKKPGMVYTILMIIMENLMAIYNENNYQIESNSRISPFTAWRLNYNGGMVSQ